MTYDEYTTTFLDILRYVPYLREEKKIERYVNGLLPSFKDKNEFDKSKTWEDAI